MNQSQKKRGKRINQTPSRPTSGNQRPNVGPANLGGGGGGGGGNGGSSSLSSSSSRVSLARGFSSSTSNQLSQRVQISTKGIQPVITALTEQTLATPLNITSPLVTGNASVVLGQYETWKVKAFRLIYEPTTSATQSGVIAIRYDPDPNDSPPATYQSFISTGYAVFGPQWERHELRVPLSAIMNLKSYFVDPGYDATTRTMSRMSIPGQFQVYTSADAAVTPIGVLTLHLSIEAKTLSETPGASIMQIVDNTPNANGTDLWSSAAKVTLSGQPGTFSSTLSTDAPNSVRHSEALKPGTYYVTTSATGTGLGTPSFSAMVGETTTDITFTTSSAIVNAALTVATITAIIVVKGGFSTSFNGRSIRAVDIPGMFLSGLGTITSLTQSIAWVPV